MNEQIWIGLSLLLMWVAGIALGVGEVAPWLHRREMRRLLRPAKLKPSRAELPVTTIVPLMTVLDGSGEKWRRLELPAVMRRRTEKN